MSASATRSANRVILIDLETPVDRAPAGAPSPCCHAAKADRSAQHPAAARAGLRGPAPQQLDIPPERNAGGLRPTRRLGGEPREARTPAAVPRHVHQANHRETPSTRATNPALEPPGLGVPQETVRSRKPPSRWPPGRRTASPGRATATASSSSRPIRESAAPPGRDGPPVPQRLVCGERVGIQVVRRAGGSVSGRSASGRRRHGAPRSRHVVVVQPPGEQCPCALATSTSSVEQQGRPAYPWSARHRPAGRLRPPGLRRRRQVHPGVEPPAGGPKVSSTTESWGWNPSTAGTKATRVVGVRATKVEGGEW